MGALDLSAGHLDIRVVSCSKLRRPSLRAAHHARQGLTSQRPGQLLAYQRRRCRPCLGAGPPDDSAFPGLEAQDLSASWPGEEEASCAPAQPGPPAAPGAASSAGQPAAAAAAAVPPPQQQQQQAQQPQVQRVPWGLATTITLMVVWLLSFWLAAYAAVPTLVELLGIDSASTAARVQALKHFLLDVIQLALTVVILRQGLREYRPRRLGLFSFSPRPWKQWLAPLAAGCCTFPVIDWVHKQLVARLSAEDYLLGGTVEQIASASDWAAHALWFAVLAVCAPVWEEVMFRGFLLPSMYGHLPKWGAVLLTATIFSMVHFTREGFLPLLLLGLVFGAVYVRTKNLWPPILLHSLWNVCLLLQIKYSAAV